MYICAQSPSWGGGLKVVPGQDLVIVIPPLFGGMIEVYTI